VAAIPTMWEVLITCAEELKNIDEMVTMDVTSALFVQKVEKRLTILNETK